MLDRVVEPANAAGVRQDQATVGCGRHGDAAGEGLEPEGPAPIATGPSRPPSVAQDLPRTTQRAFGA